MLTIRWTKSEIENQCNIEKELETALFLIHFEFFHISIVDNIKEGEMKKVNTLTMYLNFNRPITPDYEVKSCKRGERTKEKKERKIRNWRKKNGKSKNNPKRIWQFHRRFL